MAKHRQLSTLSLLGIFVTIVGLALTLYAISQSTEFRQRASEGAILYITSTPEIATKGADVKVAIDIQTQQIPIQSATVILTYPQEKLILTKMDFSGSAFDIVEENIQSSGYIKITRDASNPINGKKHLGTLSFQAKDDVSLSTIQPVNGTAILSTDNRNIYSNAVARKDDQSTSSSIFSIQFFFQFFRNLFSIT